MKKFFAILASIMMLSGCMLMLGTVWASDIGNIEIPQMFVQIVIGLSIFCGGISIFDLIGGEC